MPCHAMDAPRGLHCLDSCTRHTHTHAHAQDACCWWCAAHACVLVSAVVVAYQLEACMRLRLYCVAGSVA